MRTGIDPVIGFPHEANVRRGLQIISGCFSEYRVVILCAQADQEAPDDFRATQSFGYQV